MPLYEWKHIMDAEYFVVERNADFSFPVHIHYCYELIYITEGEMEVAVEGKTYLLRQGEAALIFPNQIHALRTPVHSRHTLCVFSPDLVGRYSKSVGQSVPKNNALRLPDNPVLTLFSDLNSEDNLYQVKGILYYLCGAFMEQTEFETHAAGQRKKEALLHACLHFIHENFTEDCSLQRLADHLKYDYAYLSKFFIASVGIPFNEYVNQLRVSHACYLLANTDEAILSIAEATGFSVLRTFNRNFRKYIRQTPGQYRSASRKTENGKREPVRF